MSSLLVKHVYCPNCGLSPLKPTLTKWRCKQEVVTEDAGRAGLPQDASAQAGSMWSAPNEAVGGGAKVSTRRCDHLNEPGARKCAGCRGARHGAPLPRLKKMLGYGLLSNDAGQVQAWKHVCPRCEEELPAQLLRRLAGSICFVGASGVGKSHYITGLERWWNKNMASLFGMSVSDCMTPVMAATIERMREDVGGWRTHNSTAVDRLFSFGWAFAHQHQDEPPPVVTIHDTGGENFTTTARIDDAYPFLRHCNALIIILDGERLLPCFGGDPPADPGRTPGDHNKAWDSVHHLVTSYRKKDYRSMPVAICVNKIDSLTGLSRRPRGGFETLGKMFENLIHEDFQPNHHGGVDLRQMGRLSDHLKRMLMEGQDCSNLITQISHTFPNHMFFPMCTLGRPGQRDRASPGRPGQGDRIKLYHPINVESSFLWLLAQWGILSIKS